jgi:hypothetical protein
MATIETQDVSDRIGADADADHDRAPADEPAEEHLHEPDDEPDCTCEGGILRL